jgi:hypothetical protein
VRSRGGCAALGAVANLPLQCILVTHAESKADNSCSIA